MNETLAIQSVQPMLRTIANQFSAQYGLCQEEIFQEIQLTALRAVRTHQPNKRTLVSWVTLLVRQSLYCKVRSPSWRERFGKHGLDLFDMAISGFSLNKLLLEVSDDAAKAITVAIQEGVEDRAYLQTILHVSYNWTEDRISRTFREVRNALQGE